MSNSYYHLDADILVIGGGSVGAMTAIWAKELTQNNLINLTATTSLAFGA